MSIPDIKSEFSRLQDTCYLDHAGAALYSDSQIDTICEYLKTNLLGNPHSLNLSSRYCHDAVNQIRYRILKHFSTNEDEYNVVFTSGTTNGLKSVVEWFDWGEGEKRGQLVYLRDAHTSVLGLREIATARGANVNCLEHEDAFERFRAAKPVDTSTVFGNSLFVFPAMCNFSGCKYPLNWIETVRTTKVLDKFLEDTQRTERNYRWFSLLDASSFVPTNNLNLNEVRPDFVVFSFYKMFGYPTGLGVLLIQKSSESALIKSYYGGGTILMALSDDRRHVRRPTSHEWYEDGTINYLSILSVRQGFETLERLAGTMDKISEKVFHLTQQLHEKLTELHHSNGQKAVTVYRDTDYRDSVTQGGIINFNLMRSNGAYVGYSEVMQVANSYGIHLRTGCFCNPGACQRHLKLTNSQLLHNYDKGHTCADNIDLIDGQPTGSVRVSFGYTSSEADVDCLMKMITTCFVAQPTILKTPQNWHQESRVLREKFYGRTTPRRPARLKNIFIYPIKSCGAFNVRESWPLTENGLQYDREWMIVSEDGVVLTQKQIPRMCLIIPNIDTSRKIMTLTSENSRIDVPLENDSSAVCESRVCQDNVKVVDCGNEVSHWLTLQLKKSGIRLVKFKTRSSTKCSLSRNLSLANQAQFLLITEESVKWLCEQLSQNFNFKEENVSRRFRSNFIISGEFEALEECKWDSVQLGSNQFQVEGPCTRCQMICIDQSTGERNREPLIGLSAALNGRIQFGIYLRHQTTENSILKINDQVVPVSKDKT